MGLAAAFGPEEATTSSGQRQVHDRAQRRRPAYARAEGPCRRSGNRTAAELASANARFGARAFASHRTSCRFSAIPNGATEDPKRIEDDCHVDCFLKERSLHWS